MGIRRSLAQQGNSRLAQRLVEAFQLTQVPLRGLARPVASSSVLLQYVASVHMRYYHRSGVTSSSLREWKRQRKDAPMTDVQRSRVTTGVGVLLIALGLLFLAQQVFGFSWSSAWPFFIVAVGLVFFAGV